MLELERRTRAPKRKPQPALEREADSMADRALSGGTAVAQPCACLSCDCPAFQPMHRGGAPLPGTFRTDMERAFGHDFGSVRVRTGPTATRQAAGRRAAAYAQNDDIVVQDRYFDPGHLAGRRLLAHELAHVVQQREGRAPAGVPQLQEFEVCPAAPTSHGEVQSLSDEDLQALLQSFNDYEQWGIPLGPEEHIAMGWILAELAQRHPDAADGQVERPAGAPLDQAVTYSLEDLGPADMLPDLEEGVVTEIDASEIPMGTPIATSWEPPLAGSPVAAGGLWGNRLVNQHLMTAGFQAADDVAVGMVAYPNVATMRGFPGNLANAQSPIGFGHTMVYVRSGGQIVSMASYAPESLVAAGVDAYRPVVGGTSRGVTPAIIQHLDPQSFPLSVPGTHGFPHTGATTIEWPVSADVARRVVGELDGASPPAGSSYLAYAERVCTGQNCVGWALDTLEPHLGGPIGLEGQSPVRHASGENTVRQGQVQRFLAEALEHQRTSGASGTAPASVPHAGGPIVAQMPRRLQVIKWGGRVFIVGGVVWSAYNVATAEEGHWDNQLARELGGFAGGFALGAAAGLICGPGAPVCSFVAGVGLGVVGGFLGSELAGRTYDYFERWAEEGPSAGVMAFPHPLMVPLDIALDFEGQDPEGARIVRRAYAGDLDALEYFIRAFSGAY